MDHKVQIAVKRCKDPNWGAVLESYADGPVYEVTVTSNFEDHTYMAHLFPMDFGIWGYAWNSELGGGQMLPYGLYRKDELLTLALEMSPMPLSISADSLDV
jgi:hypothetical protein